MNSFLIGRGRPGLFYVEDTEDENDEQMNEKNDSP